MKDELYIILSDYFFNGKEVNEDCPDIYLIRPTNSKILKEDILNLQESFKTFSQINENKVYIIDGADNMNDYAANSLLKFLEEPENNIYAFLICKNINKVLPTIKSRCQVLSLESSQIFKIDDINQENLEKTIKFIELIETKKIKSEAYIYDILNKKEDRTFIEELVNIMKYFYKDILNYKLLNKIDIFNEYESLIDKLSKINTEGSLIKKIICINKLENMLEYNLNLNLFLDKLIIDLEMNSNE